MNTQVDWVYVTASNSIAMNFITSMKRMKIPYAILVNNENRRDELIKAGHSHVVLINTGDPKQWAIPEDPVGPIYFFDESLPLTCRYLQMVRSWTSQPVIVITTNLNPRPIYRQMGADQVIYTKGHDVSFLLNEDSGKKEN